jgi:shikimate kinase
MADHSAPNIVLTGFMGTGKTTVGRILAHRLGYELVDTDVLIEARHGPIATIFRDRGEDAFRVIERELTAELADRTGLVVSTGGRLLLDPANASALGATGQVFCLVATADEILERVTSDPGRIERPLLAVADPGSRIRELLAERSDGYARFRQVPTGGRTPEAVAEEILVAIGR